MSFFSKPAIAETELPGGTDQQRYDENLRALHAANLSLVDSEQALARHHALHKDLRTATVNGQIFTRVGAMVADESLRELESRRDRCMEKRHELLAEHAHLKFALGLAR